MLTFKNLVFPRKMKNGIIIGGYFIFTTIFLILSLMYLSLLEFKKNQLSFSNEKKVAYAALPSSQLLIKGNIKYEDIRGEILTDFFRKYKSDLLPFSQNIIEAADRYGVDFRLIPAIAMQESNLCQKIIKDSFNCWGFGIYGTRVKMFRDYPNAIDTVTKTLATDYKAQGLVTPDQIMTKYTPGSNGSWARGVSHFMNQLSL